MTILKCIVVDDEPLALKLVETLIKQTPFLQLEGSCGSAVEAMQLIRKKPADLLFLDINMPNFSGLELARWMQQQPQPLPKVIFTTAYNHYAIEGYKVNAVDYLLKPFNYEEFLRAATKALHLVESATPATTTAAAEEDAIFIKVEYQWVRVNYKDILYIEGVKDYVRLHLGPPHQPVLSLTSLKTLEERLPATKFMRVHRSFIVSLDKISAVGKNSLFIDKMEITIGEQYRNTFKAFIDKWIS
ncbi:LytR/AlgR family response regulator transcription factor [Chitinophaga japonensis]|uniref:LytTR family two component transcriptional regulator n=1 Tax=Chitinophaga japonensis TaxID=104662 RepID=A0A562SZ63_CHIJA|nr:LytTR family DNA-binding domain-containing protein [Chitinophaga japonensis]TWI86348.1 LytTR family two component transcriptional regulator [Chitinophaga japonensis]